MKQGTQNLVVIALIRNNEGEILLQKRLDPYFPEAHEKWEFPGGRVDFGESPDQTIIRECREEIGCLVRIKRLLPCLVSNMWKTAKAEDAQRLVCCYEAEIFQGTPQSQDTKVGEVAWFSSQELENLETVKGIKDFVRISNEIVLEKTPENEKNA